MKVGADTVAVITGASSGIGRATAHAFAEKGATVVLASRQAEELEMVADEVRNLGGRALPVRTDVSDEQAVESLADVAEKDFGHVDVWVNNAAVTLFGRLEETPPEDWRRVVETNLFGYANGARAAITRFRERGSGVLVNVSSVVGRTGQAYTSAYTTSKSAINGLSEALRQDLVDAEDIHVVTVLPPSVDTPLFQHGGNLTGRTAKPMPPVYEPELVADAIVRSVEHPRKQEVFVGGAARAMKGLRRLVPARRYTRMMARQVEREHFRDWPAEPTKGNLYEPDARYNRTTGGWRTEPTRKRGALVTGALAGLSLAAIGVGTTLVVRRRRRSGIERVFGSRLGRSRRLLS